MEAEITEVLPDPASPQLDSADEFIELYNPFDRPLDLTGYVLKTGANWTHKYTIKEVVIEPYEYVALMSAQTHLSLSNSGTGVRLYDPNGRLVFEVPSYGKAQPAHGWVRNASGQWVWTSKPTPGEQNVVAAPTVGAKASSQAAKKSNAKAASSKKSATPKTANAVKGAATTANESAQNSKDNHVGIWVLVVAAGIGVGYALFEYRVEISGFIRRRWQALMNLGRK